AWINDKLGGDMENIKICGNYMKDCFRGMGVQKADFVWASDIISDRKYWEIVLKTAKCTSLARIKRSMTIMGREEGEAEMDSSKFLYPLMQVADIFYLGVDLAYGGMDQRKAHMLAREVADRYKWKKVVALHTPLLPGLKGGERMDPIEAKMSKSKPDTCIFLHDDPKEIERKIKKAFCPERIISANPIIGIAKNIIFEENEKIIIEREKKHGGDVELRSYSELERIYEDGALHPMDLKNSVARYLVSSIEPIRKYLEKSENFKRMREIIG
ncbi:MAG: tyrosine--tRNA ligase, partial [Candidatus Thermoplasmatota archaeon]